METNELLLWMSARQSGSWHQFRSAVEDFCEEENKEGVTDQQSLPLQHRLRFNLERLAHAEFDTTEDENGWRVAPPVLAVVKTAGKFAGILCGARSIPLLARLREIAGSATCEQTQFAECPDVIRVFAENERTLVQIAKSTRLLFQPDASLSLLSNLHPIDRIAIGPPANLPFGRDVNVEQFVMERKRCRWEKLTQVDARKAGDGLFRCTRWQSPEHYLRMNGRTFVTSGPVGKYFLLQKRKRCVIRYDAKAQQLRVPAICRPPILVDRALSLCSGFPPNEHYEQTARGEASLILSYAGVDVATAGFVAEILRQPML